MGLVNGKDVTLLVYKDGVYSGVACNASCSLNIDTDLFETTFYDSGAYRKWIPNKHDISIDGSGPIYLGETITVGDVIQWQLNRTLVSFQFMLESGADNVAVVGMGYVISSKVDGTVNQAASCDYTIKCNGAPTFYAVSTTPDGNTSNPWDYDAEGGEVEIADTDLIDREILYVAREGIGVDIITTGIPSGSQVLYTASTGTFTFGTELYAGEWIHAIYNIIA